MPKNTASGLSSLWVEPGAYPRVKHLKDAALRYAPALPANKRLGWKGLPRTNTLAYYEHS
jgi:hypothetical protein